MEDEDGEDNKIIAVPESKIDPRFRETESVEDLASHTKKEIQEFFENYKNLEPNKFVKVVGWENKDKAFNIIKESLKSYKNK